MRENQVESKREATGDGEPQVTRNDQREPQQSHIVLVVGSEEAKERGQQPAYSREVFTREVTFPWHRVQANRHPAALSWQSPVVLQ